jgi:hypothetical protein
MGLGKLKRKERKLIYENGDNRNIALLEFILEL